MARALDARSVADLTFMPAVASRLHEAREHPLAFDLDHAGPAVAVRPVPRRGLVAQVRDVGAKSLRDRPNGFAGARLHLPAVELKRYARRCRWLGWRLGRRRTGGRRGCRRARRPGRLAP